MLFVFLLPHHILTYTYILFSQLSFEDPSAVTAQNWRFYNGDKLGPGPWMPAWKVAEAKLFLDSACINEVDLTTTSFTPTEKSHYQCSDASKAFDGINEIEGKLHECAFRWGPNEWLHKPAEVTWFGIDFDEPVPIGCVQFYQFTKPYCQERIHVKYQDADDGTWKTFEMLEDLNCDEAGWYPSPPQGNKSNLQTFGTIK